MSLTLIATLSIGSIKLVSQDQWYAQSGRFEHVAVTERFREKLKQAISKGYVGCAPTEVARGFKGLIQWRLASTKRSSTI
jgi:hypothetical protein